MAGKGDKRRPMLVSMEEFGVNFDRVFGKSVKKRKISKKVHDNRKKRVLS